MFKNYILALLVFNLGACATIHGVPLPSTGTVPSGIKFGNHVKVTTLDGLTHKFVVTKIDSTGIGTNAVFFPYTKIKKIKMDVETIRPMLGSARTAIKEREYRRAERFLREARNLLPEYPEVDEVSIKLESARKGEGN